MHLAYHNSTGHKDAASTAIAEEAGAPEVIEALKDSFREWYGENDRVIYDGDTGDVLQLFFMLRTAFAKAVRSSNDAPYAKPEISI